MSTIAEKTSLKIQGGGGFVRPGTSSAGNYRSPGYGTNYGTNFAGGAGRFGGGTSGTPEWRIKSRLSVD